MQTFCLRQKPMQPDDREAVLLCLPSQELASFFADFTDSAGERKGRDFDPRVPDRRNEPALALPIPIGE